MEEQNKNENIPQIKIASVRVRREEFTSPDVEENYLEIINELKKYRLEKGVSLSAMAKKTRIDRTHISKVENRQVDNPTIRLILSILDKLDMKLKIVPKREE